MGKKIILAGGSGFLGNALAQKLTGLGAEVVVLTRSPREEAAIREVLWNGEGGGAWTAELEGAAALVNFAGRSLNCVFTLGNSQEILDSRVKAVRALGKAVAKCKRPPAVWVQCSATGYYGGIGLGLCDEELPPGGDFLAEVCCQWEEAFAAQELGPMRRVVLRLGVVLGRQGGAYPPLARLARRFLGGTAGSGQQGFSWIHLDDVLEVFLEAIQRSEMAGAYNVCAPEPVTNAEFMRALRRSVGRPWAPPAPAFAIQLIARHLMDTDPQLILNGRACIPSRLLQQGFPFKFPDPASALCDLARW